MTKRNDARRGQAGQATVMITGFVVLLVMMVAVVVDASAAYLRRQSLGSLADGAALAAADAIEGEQVYTRGLGQRATVDPGQARSFVASYLSSTGAHGVYPGLVAVVGTSGDRVVVRLSAPLDLPLPLPGVANSTSIQAESASVIAVSD